MQLVATDSTSAVAAIAALASAGLPPDVRSRIDDAVQSSGNARMLRPAVVKYFG
jgi:hypothetical protein